MKINNIKYFHSEVMGFLISYITVFMFEAVNRQDTASFFMEGSTVLNQLIQV